MASVTNQVSPAVTAVAITPADGITLPQGICRSIYIGGAGSLTIIPANQTLPVTFTAVPPGFILPVMAKSVQLTGTTATALVALY